MFAVLPGEHGSSWFDLGARTVSFVNEWLERLLWGSVYSW